MPSTRAYRTRAMRRRPQDIVRPRDVLVWWQEAHGYLTEAQRRTFLSHRATQQLCDYPFLAVKSAVGIEKKLDAALARVQRLRTGYNTATERSRGPMGPRPAVTSRSTWQGGDVTDPDTEQRRAAERRLARPEVDRPEPYL